MGDDVDGGRQPHDRVPDQLSRSVPGDLAPAVDVDLSWQDNIVACGIADAGVSSISREAGRTVTVQDVLPYAEKHLEDILTLA